MTKLRQNFEIFKKNVNIFDKPLDELLWLFYRQGNLDPAIQDECVEASYPCDVHDKCVAWPDRCEECGGVV